MKKQSLQLLKWTLVGSLTTWWRTQCSLAFEPRNLFLLVADIYRRISFSKTKLGKKIKTQQSISKYFKKETLPDDTIAELSEALGVKEEVIKTNILKTKLEELITSIKKKK